MTKRAKSHRIVVRNDLRRLLSMRVDSKMLLRLEIRVFLVSSENRFCRIMELKADSHVLKRFSGNKGRAGC